MNDGKRIAFIRPRDWPLANRIVEGVLKKQFPDLEVDLIDVSQMIRQRLDIVLINILATLWLYGMDIAVRRKKFRLAFWRTPYVFHQIRQLLGKQISKGEYAFSFQMQSMFDASTPGLSHFLYTDHTHLENLNYATSNKNNLYSRRWIDLERTVYQNATLNFVRSSNVQRSLVKDYNCPPEKAALVYAGSNAIVGSVKMENADYSEPQILFVGLDWKRKGGPDLIEAFKLVREKCPSAHLTIIGAKPEITVPNCVVIGPLAPEELDRYYQKASVFCLPTLLEPFGIVFIEAMTAHLPIVATRVGAIPDFVEEGRNGWLVEPGDIRGIADALIRVIKDPKMAREFGERSYQITQERYSWEAVGERFHQHITRALNDRSKGSLGMGEVQPNGHPI